MLSRRTACSLGFGWLLVCGWLVAASWAQPAAAPAKIYLIGNSLTWDTLPGLLEGDVQWHVDCGKNLKYIHDHPGSPCVKTSTLWPTALKSKQYDVLCVQPHFGSSLAEDVQAISAWLALQPQATLVLHTGWNRAADFEATYHAGSDGGQMVHAPEYFQALTAALQAAHPQRTIRSTLAMQVLDEIYHDIQSGQAPFASFETLYRDSIHMTTQEGRFLMHNLMRIAVQQPISEQGFQLEPQPKEYLLGKLNAVQSRLSPVAE